ncbi:MAG: redoxin domain-containing protein, partial [Chloroflexi bacterium]|nr:redoxin domain-containing protein [Chloroflexota bacterium]
MAVEVGQTAPEFTLHDQDREKRSLSDYKGQNVVLAFYPGAFTGGCTTEMCTFRDRLEQFNSLNAQVLGISVDGAFAQ